MVIPTSLLSFWSRRNSRSATVESSTWKTVLNTPVPFFPGIHITDVSSSVRCQSSISFLWQKTLAVSINLLLSLFCCYILYLSRKDIPSKQEMTDFLRGLGFGNFFRRTRKGSAERRVGIPNSPPSSHSPHHFLSISQLIYAHNGNEVNGSLMDSLPDPVVYSSPVEMQCNPIPTADSRHPMLPPTVMRTPKNDHSSHRTPPIVTPRTLREITDELEGKAGSAEKTKDSFEEKMVSKSARSSSECGDYEEVSKCAKESCECTGFGRFSMCGGETSEAAGDLYQAQTLDATQAVFAVKTLRNYFLK